VDNFINKIHWSDPCKTPVVSETPVVSRMQTSGVNIHLKTSDVDISGVNIKIIMRNGPPKGGPSYENFIVGVEFLEIQQQKTCHGFENPLGQRLYWQPLPIQSLRPIPHRYEV